MAEREAEMSEKSYQSNTSTNSLGSHQSNDCNSPIVLLPSPSFPSSSSNYCNKFQGSNLINSHQQSQLQLQQSQSPSTTFESHLSSKKRKSQCDKCKNHLVRTLIKDHKKLCPYKNCTCGRCTFTIIRRRITSMNQRKRRQKEPSKDIFDNVHMSSRLKVLDKLTDDLDSMVKNPSNYRISDELIGKFYDLLNNANFETKMRSVSSGNNKTHSESTVDPIKLTNGTNGNCDEESTAFHHQQKPSPPSLKANSLNGHHSLNGQGESEKSNLVELNLITEPCKKKIRSLNHNSELNGSSLDFATQPVKEFNSMSMSTSGSKGPKKDSTRIHEVPSIETSPVEGNLRSTSVTSAHSPSPAASPISVGSEGRNSPSDAPFMAVMPNGQVNYGKSGGGNGHSTQGNLGRGGVGGGKCRVKVSPSHPPAGPASPPLPSYPRSEGHVSIADRSPLPQTLVPPATPSPFVSPHGPLYSYLYSPHPHRFSTYPLVPLATNAFRFSGQPSPLFPSALNSVTAHNIGHSASLLQQWNRHLQQQIATHMNQQQAASNACRLTRMDP